MNTTLNTRSKILSKHGIVTNNFLEWKHPELDLVYTKQHLIQDDNEEFQKTIDNFVRRLKAKRSSLTDSAVDIEVRI